MRGPTLTRPRLLVAAIALTLLAGCTPVATDTQPRPAILVLQSPDLPDGLDLVSPAVLAFGQALAGAPIDVRVAPADPAGVNAARAAADPSVIGAVVAPFTIAGPAATDTLAGAGIPIVSLSTLDVRPSDPAAAWRRLVPDAESTAHATLAAAGDLAAQGCILTEPGTWSTGIAAAIAEAAAGSGWDLAASASGCEGVFWSGSASGAAGLRRTYDGPLLVSDQARTEGFLVAAGSSSLSMGTCGCRDLTVSAAPEDQALIHGYQLASGLDPGPYVAEGEDAGRMVLAMLEGGEPSRASMAAALSSMGSFQGIARTYAFDAEGDLARPIVRIYRAEGVRWLPVRDD